MKRAWTFVIVVVLIAACGCSYVAPSARVVIGTHNRDAAEFNARIQAAEVAADEAAPLPQWVKAWAAEDARAWAAMEAWAEGKLPTPTPAAQGPSETPQGAVEEGQ